MAAVVAVAPAAPPAPAASCSLSSRAPHADAASPTSSRHARSSSTPSARTPQLAARVERVLLRAKRANTPEGDRCDSGWSSATGTTPARRPTPSSRSAPPSRSASTRCGRPRPTAPTPSPHWRGGERRPRRSGWAPAITQLSARTPASTAMTAITLDHLSGGRFILGLGVSGPQVVEGWYGQPYAKPLARTREYVEILRRVFAPRGGRLPGRALPDAAPRGRRRHRARQAAEVDREPAARRHPDLPRRRGPEERRPGRRDRRRLAADVLLAEEPTATTAPRWPRASPGPAPGARPDDFEVTCTVPVDRRRRRRGVRRPAPPDVRALHRRHGRARRQLPLRRLQPHGLRGRVPRHPGRCTSTAARPTPSPRCRRRWSRTSPSIGPKDKVLDDLERGARRASRRCSSPDRRACSRRSPSSSG